MRAWLYLVGFAALCVLSSCNEPPLPNLPPPISERGYITYDAITRGIRFPTKKDDFPYEWLVDGYPASVEWYPSFEYRASQGNKLADNEILRTIVTEVRLKRLDELRNLIREEQGTTRFCAMAISRDFESPIANKSTQEYTSGIIVSLDRLFNSSISINQILKDAAVFPKPAISRQDWSDWYPAMVIAHHEGKFRELKAPIVSETNDSEKKKIDSSPGK